MMLLAQLFLMSCASQLQPPIYNASCFDKAGTIVYGGECFFPVTYQGTYYCYDNSSPGREKQVYITIPEGGQCIILPKENESLHE